MEVQHTPVHRPEDLLNFDMRGLTDTLQRIEQRITELENKVNAMADRGKK